MSVREQEITRYAKAYTLWDLAEEILAPVAYLQRERVDESFFRLRDVDSAARLATKTLILEILVGMDLEIVQGTIHGDLPQRARDDLAQFFDNEARIADTIPAIYINYLVDQDGRPPTKSDLQEILEVMESYVEKTDGQLAQAQQLHQMDDGRNGNDGGGGDGGSDEEEEEDRPISGGISEVGFSVKPYERINNHKAHTSSTCVMNLAEACAEHVFPGRYAIEGYVVCRTLNPITISLSEIVISRLACSYIDFGCGFNYCRAGGSVHGLNNRPIILSADRSNRTPWATLHSNARMDGVEEEITRVAEATVAHEERLMEELGEEGAVIDEANIAEEENIELLKAEVDAKKREEALAERWHALQVDVEGDNDTWLQELTGLCDLG
ncbi:hypothetical protein VE04_04658 [Pseudogymnoascus sp. 24MN13]|nr:hypothetical protein VE04_04658 [Pseudogymnoascus sp. 24MN13]